MKISNILKSIVLLTSLVFSDIAIEPYAKSYHFDRDKKYNENHKYIGAVYRKDSWDFGVATYINSHNNRSNDAYIGYRYLLYEDNIKLGVFGLVGYRSGYRTKLLGYGGLYSEYEDFYIKLAINHKLTAVTLGYIIRKF